MFDVSAGLVEPICWLRVPAKQEYAVCPENALFRNAEVVEAPGYFQKVPAGHWMYTAEVRAIMNMPRVQLVANGTRPVRVWLNGELVNTFENKLYVPAVHRSPSVAVVSLHHDWNQAGAGGASRRRSRGGNLPDPRRLRHMALFRRAFLARAAGGLKTLRQYRTNKLVRRRMNFSSDAMADFEGLLEVNRKICQQQMAEKASPTLPTNCAVLP